MNCYSVFPCDFFMIFSKIIFFLFYFLILSWLKITVTICEENTVTFFENYCSLLQCFFPHGIFYNFFQIILFNFIFFNIKLFVNYNYKSLQIRLNHVGWGSTVACITKHCELLQCFQHDFLPFFGVCFVIFFS